MGLGLRLEFIILGFEPFILILELWIKTIFPPSNLEVTIPPTRRSSARLSTNKRGDGTGPLGKPKRLHDVLENPEPPTHEDNSYIVSAQNEQNLKTPNQQIIQPKPQFSNTSQVDETCMDFDQL